MTVQRVMGTEVEYGVSVPGQPTANAMLLSAQVVNAYASGAAGRSGAPRQLGLRGGVPAARRPRVRPRRRGASPRSSSRPRKTPGMANVILPNGARLYVDHAHPEYSTPEVTNPLDAVRWDKAGELVMARGGAPRRARCPASTPINLYKNNTDNKGASYGAHENYLMQPDDAVHRRSCTHLRPVLRHPPGHLRRRSGRHRPGRPTARASRSASAPTSSRSRSAWRRRSSGRSSTPATSRTPTPSGTAGCT